MKIKALDESNCDAARRGGKEAGIKAASSRTGTGYQAGDADEWAPHHEVPVSASQVKPGVVPRKSRPLPEEACPTGVRVREHSKSTVTGNRHGERLGVSSGRRGAGSNEPGVGEHLTWGAPKAPEGPTDVRRTDSVSSSPRVQSATFDPFFPLRPMTMASGSSG